MYADLLPPAGDGWRSRAAVRDGNVLPLGNPLAQGDSGIPPAPIFAAAHTSVKDQEARSEAERAERKAGQMRSCNPMTSAPSAMGRQLRFRRRPKRARRQAQIGAGTGTPTPVSAEGNCTGARPSGLFFWTVQLRSRWRLCRLTDAAYPLRVRPVFFSARRKRKWGVHPRWTSPPGGSQTPKAAATAALPSPADQLIQRQIVEIRQSNERRQRWLPQPQLIILVGAPTDPNFCRKGLLAQVPCGP